MTSTEKTPNKKSNIKYMKSENIQISREVIETYKKYNLKIFPVNIIWDEKKKKKENIVPPTNWNNLSIEESYKLFDDYDKKRKPYNSIGIQTGSKFNGIYGIDLDFKNKEKLNEVYEMLEMDIDDIEGTEVRVKTNKGFHYYYKYETYYKYLKNKQGIGNKQLGYNIDIRGEDGFLFAPCSKYYITENGQPTKLIEYSLDCSLDDFCLNLEGLESLSEHCELFNLNTKKEDEDLLKLEKRKEKEKKKPSKDLSPKKTINIEVKEEEEKEEEEKVIEKPKKQYPINIDEIKKMVDILDINRAEVEEEWFRVGLALKNNGNITQEEDEKLFEIFNDFSKKSTEKYDGMMKTMKKWEGFKSRPDGNSLTLGSIYNWAKKDNKEEYYKIKNYEMPYQEIYDAEGYNGIVKQINKSVAYIKSSSEYIIETYEGWYIKKRKDILSDFVNKKINCVYDDKKKRMNPFILWEESPQRREVEGILFEPSDNYNKKFYNIWKGFDLKKEDYQIGKVGPLLDHIKNIWCNGNENHYNYVINWFAHLIQFPNVKMSSVIVLKSLEGAGKSIVMDLINEIIGDKHSLTISSWDEILGSFNSLAEGKVFMCLDEVTWGGNKKDAGILKNFVSGVKKNINKKGKDQYTIKDFANFVITSNNEWIIPAEKGTRRWFCLELNNKYAGISSEEKKKYFQEVRGVTKEAFAYFLNSIDVSDFNPREFEETPLLQQQVIKGWSSVVNWWFSFMDNGFLDYGESRLNLVSDYLHCPKEFGEIRDDEIYIQKDFLFNCYYNNSNGFKEGNAQFFIKLKDVVDFREVRIQKGSSRIRTIVIKKDIKILQEQFKKLQLFKYDFE